ncbi:Bromodomain-containing protein [Zopfia rhizophila CBS 207.26]|uniref:Bromodomain-containing protein n=1 Tax=Zopfia rhizophila CBS 207.26 TaxID=1314779 RepID=A0A6A6EFT9_9PEZI|nr:Bromodomain-containing protein [Zopfia rhizophila CBS 207.26]
MAVMTSSAFDTVPFEAKATSFPAANTMALDSEANGVPHTYDVHLGEPDSQPTETPAQTVATESQPQPTLNGNHSSHNSSAPAIAPTADVLGGIEGVGQFPPDSQADTNSLFDGSEIGVTSIPNAVEAPTSDVREEVGPHPSAQQANFTTATQASSDSTQQVPETQFLTVEQGAGELSAPDAMDISQDSVEAPSTTEAPTASSGEAPPTNSMTELSLQTQKTSASPQIPFTQSPTSADQEMAEAPSSGKVRSREEDDEDGAPEAKRTKTDEEMSGQAEFKVPEVPTHSEQPNGNAAAPPNPVDQTPVQSAVEAEEWPPAPMTQPQIKFLLERVRNTKKIKVAYAFKDPVNPEALNIPHYRDVIKNPMDLTTMETKLKESKYSTVRDFMQDLDLVVDNSVTFNGKDHPITQAGYNMRAYFLKGMGKMPKTDAEEPAKQVKPKKPTVATSTKPRRESRTATTTAKSPTTPAVPAASPQTTWPLNSDGMPLIRRDSSSANDRPKREIHRPPPKDLPYNSVKPKKKKYQQELKFCESVMTEIMKPKYQKFSYPFLKPVDPVALNIPTYLKIVKKPMDFGTIEKNLKEGQYQTAKDFYNDALLVFNNCYKFNIEGDEVHRMGKMLHELFNSLWNEKQAWLAEHAPASDPQSPASGYSEDEEEEEEEEADPAQEQILAIQKQIQALNETAQALLQQKAGKRTSPKAGGKKKSAKSAQPKKKSSLVPPPQKPVKPKARTKAPAPLSFAQKQEISDGISTLGDSDMRKAVQIIRNGCPHLANVNDDEMEIDMDEISDDTLRELLKFIKQVKGPKVSIDDDFEPPRVSHKTSTHRTKKNKPMGKKEQEDSIKKIQEQLRVFQNSASGSSQSPPAHADESSDDDDESGSESEEE